MLVTLGLALAACIIGVLAIAAIIVGEHMVHEERGRIDDLERQVHDLEAARRREHPEPWAWPESGRG